MNDPQDGTPPEPLTVYIEVTNTVSIPYTTGIQRVVREVVAHLGGTEFPDIDVVPLFRPAPQMPYRRLTPHEMDSLGEHPAGGTAGRRADRFGPLSPIVRFAGDTRAVYRFRIAYRNALGVLRERRAGRGELAVSRMEPASIFMDLEGSWFDPEPRSLLLPRLRSEGVEIVTFIHDVMPMLFPEWFPDQQIVAFTDWLDAHLRESKMFLTNSECTTTDLIRVATARGFDIENRVQQITLGADFATMEPEPVDAADGLSRYLLVVGTIEPRKNHRLVLQAWDRVRRTHPDVGLVLVGKEGWMVDDVVSTIRSHPEFGHRLRWLGGIEDRELAWLYQNAFLTIAPSLYEGLGVPVIEALKWGCPTIASTGGALPEAAGGLAELIDPTDVDGLVELVVRHLDHPDHHAAMVRGARTFHPPTWQRTAREIASALRHSPHDRTEPGTDA